MTHADPDDALAQTQSWLERAVIGLELCLFAKAVHQKRQIRWVVSRAASPQALLEQLNAELLHLAAVDPQAVDTTLIVHPQVLQDFLDYNDFLDLADAALEALELDGTLQIAGFHPQFQFSDSSEDDAGNLSNRSPFPTLHLLREASVDRAVAAFPQAETIYERNIATLQALGFDGWRALLNPEVER